MTKKLYTKIINCFIFYLLLASPSAYAQVTNLPGNVDPGAVDQTNRLSVPSKDAKKLIDKKEAKKEKAPKVQKSIIRKDVVYNPKFLLKGVNFEGNTVFPAEELNKLSSPIVGKEVFIDDVAKIAVKITQMYRKEGYITSQAYLPPQKVKGGMITIKIIESKIGNLAIKNNKWAKTKYLNEKILRTNGISEDEIFNARNLKVSLKELNRRDYIKGGVMIEQGITPDQTDLTVDVEDRFPLNFNVTWDNEGRRLVGTQRAIIMLRDQNVTGFGDEVYAGTILAHKTVGAVSGYKVPVGPWGTELMFDYSYSNVELGKEYKPRDIDGFSHNIGLGVMQPIVSKPDMSLKADMSMDFINAETTENSINKTLTKYNIRALRTGLDFLKDDSQGRWISRLETSVGLPLFGATDADLAGNSGKYSTTAKFFKVNADIARIQRLYKNAFGIFRVASQYSPDKLYGAEQFLAGGGNFTRGFEQGFLIGDYGLNGTFEVRTQCPFINAIIPDEYEQEVNDRFKLGYFYDWGWVKENRVQVNNGASFDNFLHSVGMGFHFDLSKYSVLNFDIGVPIGKERPGARDVRLHFSITSNIHNLFLKEIGTDEQTL